MSNSFDVGTQFLQRPEGRVAYDVQGTGPLVVCIPGMGDLRATYRFLTPALVAAGHRVATFDLRGHGDSDTTFTTYDDEAAAGDALALIEHLSTDADAPACVVGNSMGAGAGVIAAAQRPDLVGSLILMGPFVRNPPSGAWMRPVFAVLTARPWARAVWSAYLPSLYAGRKPDDFDAYRRQVSDALGRPGHAAAFSCTTRTTHDPAEAVLPHVRCRSLVVMGRLDPDFKDPALEASWIGERLGSETLLVDEAGHYPQSQRPDVVNEAVVSFLGAQHA